LANNKLFISVAQTIETKSLISVDFCFDLGLDITKEKTVFINKMNIFFSN